MASNLNPITPPQSLTYRPDIDGLRAIAVLAVFIFHAFPKKMRGGFVGVDIFFVISGFLISSIIFTKLETSSFSFWDFYSRRIRRIYPALITVLTTCLSVGFLFLINYLFFEDYFLINDEFAQLGKHIAGGATYISNFILWLESGYFDSEATTKPLLHLWSLGIEEQFYIFWPLLLWIAYKCRINLLVVCLALAIPSFGYNLYLYKTDPTADFYSPLSRFWELLIGASLAWYILHAHLLPVKFHFTTNKRIANALSCAGIIILLLSFFAVKITSSRFFPGAWALIPILGTVLVITSGSSSFINRYVLSNKILVWIGLISYPLYLWHWPILSFGRILSRDSTPLWYRILALPICILLAWVTTRFIEKPLRFGNYVFLKTIGLFIVMGIVGFSGYIIYNYSGFLKESYSIINKLIRVQEKAYKTNPAFNSPCYVEPNKKTDYQNCPDLINHPKKRTLVLWGDSQATHLVGGFKKHLGDRFNIWSRSTGACTASMLSEKDNPSCIHNNKLILNEIINNAPRKVVLAGRWYGYNYEKDFEKFEKLIQELKKNNIKDIIVFGSTPVWNDKLPTIAIKAYLRNERVANYFPYNDSYYFELDNAFKKLCEKLEVQYISLSDYLCKNNECLGITLDTNHDPLYFDTHHLTLQGSEYVLSLIKDLPCFR